MNPAEMERLFQMHRDAERQRDFDGVMKTFTENCYLETIALGSRSEGQAAARAAVRGLLHCVSGLDAR